MAYTADIVFMPYNYVLDPSILQSFKLDIKNAVVIIDEAHNMTQTLKDIQCFDLTFKQYIGAMQAFKKIKTKFSNEKGKY